MFKFIKKVILFFLVLFLLTAGYVSIWALSIEIPDFNTLLDRKVIQSSKIYDRTGEILLYDVFEDVKRTIVTYDKIPRHIKNATVSIEDDNFYYHKGVDPFSILRAFVVNLKEGRIAQGGSTITQQLAKNTFLTPEKTLTRKLKEFILSIKLEQTYSKDNILELYLNEISYGSNSYGVESASQTFFKKSARDITLAEASYLAALPKAPSYYSPYGSHKNELDRRKDMIIDKMFALGFITEEEKKSALTEQVVFKPKEDNDTIKAPHFVIMIKDYLENKYGEDAVISGGFKIITTLDWELQKKAEEVVKKFVEENEEKYDAYNAGMVGMNPKTGEIMIMVGSRDWFGKSRPEGCIEGVDCKFESKVNITTYSIGRQPGSAFKPFAYAEAFKKGYSPETVLFDLQTEFNPSCDPDLDSQEKKLVEILKINPKYEDECYHPRNYDNVFRGPMTMREALAQSVNIPSVKTLYLAGIADTIKTARAMGITTLNDPQRYGLTLVLGGGEVKLLDITGAYSVFANDGVKIDPSFILKIEDVNGKIIEQSEKQEKRVLDEQIARLINDVLSDNKARTPAFGEFSPLYFPGYEVAAKTGTTNDSRDAWIVGYTPNFALGAWAGNNDNSVMKKKVAGFIVAPMWNAFFQEAITSTVKENFSDPKEYSPDKPVLRGEWRGSEVYLIDSISKKLATEFTPIEMIKEKVLTQVHSILYWVDKDDPTGDIPQDKEIASQFSLWEFPVRKWVETQNITEETVENIPTEVDDVHKPEYKPKLSIIYPQNNTTVSGDNLRIKVEVSGHFNIKQVDFFLGKFYLGSKKNKPYELLYDLTQIESLPEKSNLIIKAYDEVGNKEIIEYNINF